MTESKQKGPKTALDTHPFAIFKYCYAVVLLAFSVFLIMGFICTGQTTMSKNVHPVIAFIVCWACIIWMNMVEGGQCSLVGLPPVDRSLYKASHPTTHAICEIAHRGDNLNRYLLGRQFLVVFIVFFINMSAGPAADASAFGLPDWVVMIFLQTGIAMILFTAQVGQLASQCNASHMMLDYINNGFMIFTFAVCMFVEFSGLVHASYLIQYAVAAIAGKPIQSKEPPRSVAKSIFFWGRCLMSLGVLTFALIVTLSALFQGKTTMWESIPNGVAVVLFFVLMSVVGLLEGMQIAFFAVTKMDKAEVAQAKCAKMTCDVLFDEKGHNLPGFMIGRQICVVGCMFIVARVCTLNVEVGTGQNVLGVSDGFQSFLNTGLLAALITTILGSIAWQLVADAFPIAFLSNPVVYFFLRWCLFLEGTGICHGAWVLARITELITGWQTDEAYIGSIEERKQQDLAQQRLQEAAVTKVPAIANQMIQILKDWQGSYSQAELTSFCKQMCLDSPAAGDAPESVEAFMANEGMCGSGVNKLSDIVKDYEPTPKQGRYPNPKQVAECVLQEHGEIPCFLLPPSHPLHVPPHVVAFWLMSQQASKPLPTTEEKHNEV